MKVVLELDDSLLAKALLKTQEQKITFDSFVNQLLRTALESPSTSIRRTVDINIVLENAVAGARRFSPGTEFHLESLCDPDIWSLITGGERKILGKSFRKAVEAAEPRIAMHVGRTSANKAIYKRV